MATLVWPSALRLCMRVVAGSYICCVFSFSPIALPTAHAHSLTSDSFKSDSDDRKNCERIITLLFCFSHSLRLSRSIFVHFLIFSSHSRISMPLLEPVFLCFCGLKWLFLRLPLVLQSLADAAACDWWCFLSIPFGTDKVRTLEKNVNKLLFPRSGRNLIPKMTNEKQKADRQPFVNITFEPEWNRKKGEEEGRWSERGKLCEQNDTMTAHVL